MIPNKVILWKNKESHCINDEDVKLLFKHKKKEKRRCFRYKEKNYDFDSGILNKLPEDLNLDLAITNSKLVHYRRIASKLNDPN